MGETKDRAKLLKLYSKQRRIRNSGEMLSPEGTAIQSKLDSILILERDWQNDYIEKNIDLHSLSLVYNALREYDYFEFLVDLSFVKSILPQFSEKFPSHSWNSGINGVIKRIINEDKSRFEHQNVMIFKRSTYFYISMRINLSSRSSRFNSIRIAQILSECILML